MSKSTGLTDEEKIKIIGEGKVSDAKKILKEEEKESKEKRETVLEFLENKGKRLVTYNRLVSELLTKRLVYYVDWRGWSFKIGPTDIGVVLEIYSPDKKIYRSAFKTTGLPKYDLFEIDRFAELVENTIEKHSHGQTRIITEN